MTSNLWQPRPLLALLALLTFAFVDARETQDAAFADAWVRLFYERVKGEGLTPPVAARIYAYAGVALHEAVAASTPGTPSLARRLNDLNAPPVPAPETSYDVPTVLSATLATVTKGLFERTTARWQPFAASTLATKGAISELYGSQLAARQGVLEADLLRRSLRRGLELGEALLAWAETDTFGPTRTMTYRSAAELHEMNAREPASWLPRAFGREPVEPYWARVRPFTLTEAGACHVPLEMAFSTDPASAFYGQALEVYETSQTLTDEQAEIAFFWDDEAKETGTVPGHFMMIASEMVQQHNLSLREAAQLYATLSVALHDAFVSAWTSKYEVMLLRPDTFINAYIDPDWKPLLDMPNFPEYPSGHSVGGAAAAVVLTHFFGDAPFNDPYGVINELPGYALGSAVTAERPFSSFWAAAEENALSRLYGGVHYRVAIDHGMEQGTCVGQRVLANLGDITRRSVSR